MPKHKIAAKSASPKIIIRLLQKTEFLPETLPTGFEALTIYPDWCWVVEKDGKIVACCLAAAAHGLLFILRIVATKEAPYNWGVVLLRRVLRDANKRGCAGFTSFLDPTKDTEAKLIRIAERANCYFVPAHGVYAIGRTDLKRKEKS